MRYMVGGLVILGALAPSALTGQSRQRTFVLHTATDTIAVELVTRSPGRLEGELVFRAINQRWHYVATLGPDDLVRSLDNEFRLAGDSAASPPRQSAHLEFTGDSVIVTIAPPGARVQRLGTQPGAIPFINPSFALFEQGVLRARRLGGDSLVLPFFAVSGGQTFQARVRRAGGDTVMMSLQGAPMVLVTGPDGFLRSGGVPQQGLALSVVEGVLAGAMTAERPDYSAPPDAPYRALDVRVPTPMGHVLAGTLTLPTGVTGAVPALVLITGSGLQDRDETISLVKGFRPFREIADALGRRGIAVLRMDDRGFGASGGNPSTATTEDFANDIRAGLAFLRARSEIDAGRLGLLGHSEGGIIAPMIAATDSTLRGIILMAGSAWTGRRISTSQNQAILDHQPGLSQAAKDSIMTKVVPQGLDSVAKVQPWFRFFADYDPVPTARRVKVPVLILQGATDHQVTPEQAGLLEQAFRAGGNHDVTAKMFPATNHLFLEDADGAFANYPKLTTNRLRPEVLTTIAEWVAAHLR